MVGTLSTDTTTMTVGGLAMLAHYLTADEEMDMMLALGHKKTLSLFIGKLQRRHHDNSTHIMVIGYLPLYSQSLLT